MLKSSIKREHFSFIHINPGSLKPNFSEIRLLLEGVDLHLLAVSETWFTDSHNSNLFTIPGYELLRHDRKSKRGGGVAFYIKNGLKFKLLATSHRNSLSEFMFIEIDNCQGTKFACGVVYNPPANTRLDPLARTLTNFSNYYSDLIILGDFNINLLNMSSHVNRFKDLIASINLVCCSTEPTNFVPGKNPSLIDLCLVKNLDLVKTFSQLPLGSFTSHDLIYGSYLIPMSDCALNLSKKVRNFSRINLNSLLNEAYLLNWDEIYSFNSIDEKIRHLEKQIKFLMDSFAPLHDIKLSFSDKPKWLSEKLIRLINARDYFHDAARRTKNLVLKSSYNSTFRNLRNKVTTLKRNSKAEILHNDLRADLPPQTLWKNLKRMGITKRADDPALNYSPDEFNSYFSSVFSCSTVNNISFDATCYSDGEFEFSCVEDEEILSAISLIKSKAVGEDEIPVIFIKMLCPIILPFLKHIINACITQSYFPERWKVAVIRPIAKIPNPSGLVDFRPISILPVLSKILERIMKIQLQKFISDNDLLFDHQSGFRAGYSTNTAMLKVVDDLSESLEKNEASVIVFLDFKKAFDMVDHKKLLEKLNNRFNVSTRSCNLLKSFLSNRSQRVKVGELCSDLLPVSSGTPQGGILSALLFSLYINDLPDAVDINLHLYADDSQFYVSAPVADINSCICKMNDSLSAVNNWSLENSISINPSKSKALIVTKKKINILTPIKIGSDAIEIVDSIVSLGLRLNSDLTWDDHVNKICNEIKGGLCMLWKSQYFTPQSTRLRLVQALLIPKLTYCSNIYMGCSRASWDKIRLTFNACLRYIFNLKKFDSVSNYTNNVVGCNIENFLYFRSCLFLFKLIKTKNPLYLYSKLLFPRLQRNGLLNLPTLRKSKQRNMSFFVQGIRLWNSLNSDLRTIVSTQSFRRECLDYFASNKTQVN